MGFLDGLGWVHSLVLVDSPGVWKSLKFEFYGFWPGFSLFLAEQVRSLGSFLEWVQKGSKIGFGWVQVRTNMFEPV